MKTLILSLIMMIASVLLLVRSIDHLNEIDSHLGDGLLYGVVSIFVLVISMGLMVEARFNRLQDMLEAKAKEANVAQGEAGLPSAPKNTIS